MIDFEAWSVDVLAGKAVHATGFAIVIEGDPADPSGVAPSRFPESLTAVQQATLLRCGIEMLTKAAAKARQKSAARRFHVVGVSEKTAKEGSTRPILSLKT